MWYADSVSESLASYESGENNAFAEAEYMFDVALDYFEKEIAEMIIDEIFDEISGDFDKQYDYLCDYFDENDIKNELSDEELRDILPDYIDIKEYYDEDFFQKYYSEIRYLFEVKELI